MTSEKAFDCVRVMRELRDELSREMQGMTAEERVEFIDGEGERGARALGLPAAIDPRLAAERARAGRQTPPRAA
jgi:hypothetical protein